MHIVILGAGSVGFHIAKQLIDEGKDVVIIEKDPKAAKHAMNYLDCLVIQDVGNNIEVLKNANIDKADFFISVTNSDEVNMIACGLVASNTSVPNKPNISNLGSIIFLHTLFSFSAKIIVVSVRGGT